MWRKGNGKGTKGGERNLRGDDSEEGDGKGRGGRREEER